MKADAPGVPVPFAAIAARLDAGERVILPAAGIDPIDGASRPRPWRHGALRVASAALVLIAIAAALVGVPHASAERSELHIMPGMPAAGETLTVEYRATARLAAEERLTVRARYRTSGQGSQPRTVTVGELRRAGAGRFTGSFALPDSAVYAVLAVENAAGSIVDDARERWEVLVRGEDGRPLFEALRQRLTDALRRNTLLAADAMDELTAAFPHEPAGWYFLYAEASLSVPDAQADSLRDTFRTRLPALEASVRELGGPDAEQLWYLIMHAGAIGETATRDRLREELIRRFPTDGGALQHASWIAAERHRGDVDAYLAALDSIFAVNPDAAVQAAFDALQTAQRLGSPQLILRWVERLEIARPEWRANNGSTLVEYDSTREAGIERLRAGIAELERGPGERPLSRSVAEHEAERARTAGMLYAALGRALLTSGRAHAAIDTLDRALVTGWNTSLFRAVGDARLQLGDTAGAVSAFARLAADPNTPQATADSLQTALGERHSWQWAEKVDAARGMLRAELLDRSVNRAPPRTRLRLSGLDGSAHDVRLDDGVLTVVAFWSRFCPPSAADLPRLDAVARHLTAAGVRFLGIADESDADAVAAFLERNGHGMATYVDPDRDAHYAFDNRTTPYYVVIDERGRIRFTGHLAEDVVRQIAVLGGPWRRLAD